MRSFLISIITIFVLSCSAFGDTFTNVYSPSVAYVNYSGCAGTSTAVTGTRNSVFLVAPGTMAKSYDQVYLQAAAWSSSLSFLITDNNSHTVATKATNNVPWIAWELIYNGTGTCIVRLMSSTTKANFPAIPVAAP